MLILKQTLLFNHILLLLIFLIFYSYKVNARELYNILINKPNIGEGQYLSYYNDITNRYFILNNITDVEVKFSYCNIDPEDGKSLVDLYKSYDSPFLVDKEYAAYFNCTLRELKQSNFDLMVLDERVLFSDNSYIDNTILQTEFSYHRLTDYLISFDVKEEETIKFHDANILKDGYFETENLYGLPYELDFDILYYHNMASNLKDALNVQINDLQNVGNENVSGVVSVGFSDNDELLNFFGEFIRYQYNDIKESDPSTYNLLYLKKELVQSLRNYLISITGTDLDKTLSTSVEEAFNSFMEGKKPLYKGKASFYKSLKEKPNNDIQVRALPENKSALTEKYIVMNRNSLKSKELLEKMALQLTSKEMQHYRAIQLGTIPTFNFEIQNEEVKAYCQTNMEICNLLRSLDPIRIRNVFKKSKFSASFLEDRLVLPLALKQSLVLPNNDILRKTFMNIIDVWNQSFTDKEMEFDFSMIMFMVLNVFTIAVAIYFVVIFIMVYRNRNHPYIKAMSPFLTNFTIFGIIVRILYPYSYNLVTTRFLCRMSSVLNFLVNNLVYLPLFAIILRIYLIFTNASSYSYSRHLHDRKLILYIIIALIISIGVYYEISSFDEFNLTTAGSISINRLMTCMYDFDRHSYYSNIYTLILFVIMIYMTVKVHKLSKKYGDTKFILFIVLLLISSFIFEFGFASFFKTNGASSITPSSMVFFFVHIIVSIITVHYLIGNRLLYLRKHPMRNRRNLFNHKNLNNIHNLIDFIPMRKNETTSFNLYSNDYSNTNSHSNIKDYMTTTTSSSYLKYSSSGLTNMETVGNDNSAPLFSQTFQKYTTENDSSHSSNTCRSPRNSRKESFSSSISSSNKKDNVSNINPYYYNYYSQTKSSSYNNDSTDFFSTPSSHYHSPPNGYNHPLVSFINPHQSTNPTSYSSNNNNTMESFNTLSSHGVNSYNSYSKNSYHQFYLK
ncbi:hypothetical protein U3516DRAFT_622743 [Neocallimastix sp. 'constans']|jgi:hypothetical protein